MRARCWPIYTDCAKRNSSLPKKYCYSTANLLPQLAGEERETENLSLYLQSVDFFMENILVSTKFYSVLRHIEQ